jgi:hypothetical protein
LITRYSKKARLKKIIQDSLNTLLDDDTWFTVAVQPPLELKTRLLEICVQNEALCKRLTQGEAPVEAPVEKTFEELLPTKAVQIRSELQKSLEDGVLAMQKLKWEFPPPSATSAASDEGLQAFMALYNSVNRLQTMMDKERMDQAMAEEYLRNLTQQIERHWPLVVQYLTSMAVVRQSDLKRIKFVVESLSRFFPTFSAAADASGIHVAISKRMSDPSIHLQASDPTQAAFAAAAGYAAAQAPIKEDVKTRPSISANPVPEQARPKTNGRGSNAEANADAVLAAVKANGASEARPKTNGERHKTNAEISKAAAEANADAAAASAKAIEAKEARTKAENELAGKRSAEAEAISVANKAAVAAREKEQVARATRIKVKWMWADARMAPGLHFLAKIDPLRWSASGTAMDHAKELEQCADERPVTVSVEDGTKQNFKSPVEAAKWLRRGCPTS